MQQRLLVIAIVIAAVVLAMLGAHRLWERAGTPSTELENALAMQGLGLGAAMPSGLLDEAPVSDVEGFLVASVTETTGQPSTPREPATITDPWSSTFEDDLCAGQESAWLAFERLSSAADASAIDLTLASRIGDAASHGCLVPESERACTFARGAIESGEPRAQLGWALLAHCSDELALPLLDRVDAPGTAILRFVIEREAFERRPVRLPAYLLQSVTSALASTGLEREQFPFHALAGALGHYDDPSATRALVAMYEAAPGYAREAVGIEIHHADDDRSRAIHQESCATVPAESLAHACHDGTIATRVASARFDPHLELARHPEMRTQLVDGLAACANGGEPYAAWHCFRALAEVDRARAAASADARIVASNVPLLGLPAVGDPPPFVSSIEHEVRRFPSEGSLVAALASCGIQRSPRRAWEHPVTVLDALAARDHALALDPESGTYPTPHDLLLRRIARLVSPALDEVTFEQIAPDETQMAVGRYTLRAFMGGRVIASYARNYGDFYDVEAVVGFVNALLVRRGAMDRCRFVEGTETAIVCASLPQLAALESAQLLVVGAEQLE